MKISKKLVLFAAMSTLLFIQSAQAFQVDLVVNNDTDKYVTTPGIVEEDFLDGREDSHDVPVINKVVNPRQYMVAIDKPQQNLKWWGLISIVFKDLNGKVLYPCLEDSYWAVSKSSIFEVTLQQHGGSLFHYYTCSHKAIAV